MDILLLELIADFGFTKIGEGLFENRLGYRYEQVRIFTEDNYKTITITWFVNMDMRRRYKLENIKQFLADVPKVINQVKTQQKGNI
jgi:hypothetical protein